MIFLHSSHRNFIAHSGSHLFCSAFASISATDAPGLSLAGPGLGTRWDGIGRGGMYVYEAEGLSEKMEGRSAGLGVCVALAAALAAAFLAVLICPLVTASASRKETARLRRRVCRGSGVSELADPLSSNTGNEVRGTLEAAVGLRGGEDGRERSVDCTSGTGTGLVERGGGAGCRNGYRYQLPISNMQSIICKALLESSYLSTSPC